MINFYGMDIKKAEHFRRISTPSFDYLLVTMQISEYIFKWQNIIGDYFQNSVPNEAPTPIAFE